MILQRKIHLELRIPVFQRLHCNWHKIRRVAALCIWFEGAFGVPKWQLPGVFVICSKIAFFWKVNENYEISKIRRVAAFWTLFENDPKWQLPGGFSFFKNVHFWTILATVIKFQHFWYAQNVATLRVLVCCRHCCLHVQHQAWPRNTIFCNVLQNYRMLLDAQLESRRMQFCNECWIIRSMSSLVFHPASRTILALNTPNAKFQNVLLKSRLINWRRA